MYICSRFEETKTIAPTIENCRNAVKEIAAKYVVTKII